MSRTALLRGLAGARRALPANSPVMTSLPLSWEDRRTVGVSPVANATQMAGAASVVRSFASFPTAATVADMHRGNQFHEMDNDSITLLAAQGDIGARAERLIREIMSVDEVSWDDANAKLNEMRGKLNEGLGAKTLPQKIFIGGLIISGFATFPLCFDLNTALVFNELYVTTDVAEPEDLETWLEVGSWTWNWMEPPLGQLSFFILCIDFARAQLNNLGFNSYFERMIENRGNMLAQAYPQYHKKIVTDFGTCNGLKPF